VAFGLLISIEVDAAPSACAFFRECRRRACQCINCVYMFWRLLTQCALASASAIALRWCNCFQLFGDANISQHIRPKLQLLHRPPLLFAMALTEAVVKRVSQIVSEAKSSGSHVSSWDRMVRFLESHNLSWEAHAIPPSHVAVHPENRSGMMLDPVQMHVLGSKIAVQGWSPDRAKGVCIQMPTDAASRAAIMEKNNFTYRPCPSPRQDEEKHVPHFCLS
jgi:hypothetical protein